MTDTTPTKAGRDSLPPQQKLILRILERHGLPTLIALALGAAFWYWSDRTAKERLADREAIQESMRRIRERSHDVSERVHALHEAVGRIEVILLMQGNGAGKIDTPQLSGELARRRDRAAALQRSILPVRPVQP